MDNTGLGENVEHHARFVDADVTPHDFHYRNDDAHLEPTRWWFASSAFPMIAGTLGPVASAFSICALVRPWRQICEPGQPVDKATFVDDPPWLIIVNAIQLAVAIVANAFLLLNMARTVRFSIAQPVTIVGWYISALSLIILDSMAAGPLRTSGLDPEKMDQYIWSQAFYYGIWAAILYFIMATLMLVTFLGALSGRYEKDFKLTTSQRTLMLQTIMLLMYMLIGALVFSNIETWNYLDAVYWATVTLFTVGFGDYAAITTLGRALLFPYALVGVISLGLVIASIRSLILQRGRRRLDARAEEKNRRKFLRVMTSRGQDSILNPIHGDGGPGVDGGPNTEYERRKAEFLIMRRIQDQAVARRRWFAMAISTGSWLVLWLIGATIFYESEKPYQDWTYFDGFYFCFVTLTTIGYGDKTPISNAGKSFFVFWALLALPTMTVLISNAEDTVVKFIRDGTILLGNITILPSDDGFSGTIKHTLSRLACGMIFQDFYDFPRSSSEDDGEFVLTMDAASDNDISSGEVSGSGPAAHPASSPPNPRSSRDHLDVVERGRHHREPSQRPRDHSTFTSKIRRSLSRLRDPLADLPEGTDFHFLLISEIQNVSDHMRESEPRRYSYEEWAWYLRLIGQDERDPRHHGKPAIKNKHNVRSRHRRTQPKAASTDNPNVSDDPDEYKWSWVGNRSPLMGSQEESEWIFERLTTRLRESLSTERRRQLNKKPRGSGLLYPENNDEKYES